MSHCILNLLPITEAEAAEFISIAPDAAHIVATRSTVTKEQLAAATIIFGAPLPEDIHRAPNLKWLHSMWVGVDEYISDGRFPNHVMLSNSAGTNAQAVSEHMFACLLALCRKLPQARDSQNAHLWQEVGGMKTLTDSTVLIVGAGNIGVRFGALCQHMGAHTIGLRRQVGAVPAGLNELHPIAQLDALLPCADVVALCLPHTQDTVNLIDARRFALLKQDAMLISAGRGTVLDQDALVGSLTSGRLWGAALDVTDPEPLPQSHPLWDAPNLLLTPHIAGGMRLEITRKNCIKLAQENLIHYLEDKPLKTRIQL